MGYTAPTTITTGQLVAAALMNAQWGGNISFLANPPACRAYHNAAQSTTTGVHTALALNSERFDTDTMHDTVTNNSRLTINTAGLYVVTGMLEFAAVNTTGIRQAELRVNGNNSLLIAVQQVPALNSVQALAVAAIYKFAATDYVELCAFQNSTATLSVNASPIYSPELAATWIGLG